MKKTLIIVLLAATALTFVGFRALTDHAAATVESQQGLLIFHMSKPAQEFEFLGTVKTPGIITNTKFETILDILLKRAKKEYPYGQGIIMRDFEADVIKFKE